MMIEGEKDKKLDLSLIDRVVGLSSIDSKFIELDGMKDNPVVLQFFEEERAVMKAALAESGSSVEITDDTREELKRIKFHNMNHGRGRGVTEVLGEERAAKVARLVEDLSIDEPRFQAKDEDGNKLPPTPGSENWGHYQLVADLVSIALSESDEEARDFVLRLNRKLWKGARVAVKKSEEALAVLDSLFEEAEIPKPGTKTARVLPENVYPIWMAITGREIEP